MYSLVARRLHAFRAAAGASSSAAAGHGEFKAVGDGVRFDVGTGSARVGAAARGFVKSAILPRGTTLAAYHGGSSASASSSMTLGVTTTNANANATSHRGFAAAAGVGSPLSPEEVKKRMDQINDSFAEAREEIECAMEAVGTTYFNEEAEYAQEVTGKVLDMYYALCDQMDPEERAATQRAMGMKMEQLKAELTMLDHAHDDD